MNVVHVLVSDPAGKQPVGYIFTDHREYASAQIRGCVMLPVDEDLVPPHAHAALDGFFIRSWGGGWLAAKGSGERCCPMVLRVVPERTNIHWVVRVEPVKGTQATGRVRLTGDSSQVGYLSAGLSHPLYPELVENIPIDEKGGWTLRGLSGINVTSEGLLAMSLHAVARNCRVMWSAVALTSVSGIQ